MTATAQQAPSRRWGTRRKVGVWLFAIGVVVGSFAMVRLVQSARHIFDWTRLAAPGSTTVALEHGRWAVYQEDTIVIGHAMAPSDVRVSGDASTPVAASDQPTLTINGVRYRSAVEFSVPATGDYVVTIGEGTARRAVIARPFGTTVRSVLLWGLLAGVAGIAGIVGLVLALIGEPAPRGPVPPPGAYFPPPAMVPPPGWYADPEVPGGQRWWDGQRWTQHTAPPR